MRYMILIHSNPRSRAIWERFSGEEQADGFATYGRIASELAESGELIVTEALGDASLSWRSEATEPGFTTSGDGPFPEAKELLAGFFLVECASMDRAIEIASGLPEAPLGLIEVRPVMDLSAEDL
jgi:hypothetical protein